MPDLEKIEMPHAFGLGPPPSEDEALTWIKRERCKAVGKMHNMNHTSNHMKLLDEQDESCQ